MKKIVIALSCFAFAALSKDILLSNDPVDIVMPVGEEIRVEFPELVMNLDIEPNVDSNLKTFIKPNGAVYWTAQKPFNQSRVIATTASGEVILLDIKTGINQDKVVKLLNKNSTESAVKTVQKTEIEQKYALMPQFLKNSYEGLESVRKETKSYSYIDMAQFAMQHYMGPSRLIDDLPAARVSRRTPKTKMIRVWGGDLKFTMLNQWVLNKHYITALKVKNTSNNVYIFDPKAIRGDYLFVSSLADELPPSGSYRNETVWVFITKTPFHKAFRYQFK